jgi:peptide-methionine (S)-S-oxide reductase
MTHQATFAAGCFWGVEATFRQVVGVHDARVGYTGGRTPEPSYQDVCTGGTGHAEAVTLWFDPARVTYEALLDVFWQMHDPTTPNRQGPDIGSQYRSAIFTHSPQQAQEAVDSKARWAARFPRPIVTEIMPAGPFYEAEAYHQRYAEKHSLHCHPVPGS